MNRKYLLCNSAAPQAFELPQKQGLDVLVTFSGSGSQRRVGGLDGRQPPWDAATGTPTRTGSGAQPQRQPGALSVAVAACGAAVSASKSRSAGPMAEPGVCGG